MVSEVSSGNLAKRARTTHCIVNTETDQRGIAKRGRNVVRWASATPGGSY